MTAEVPSTALAMGNLDPVAMFKDATPQQMEQATLQLMERMKDYPNFVISSGCDTPPHAPLQNIDAFFRAVERGNRR